MFTYKFRTGNITIAFRLPESLTVSEPYSRFLYDGECEYNIGFDYCDKLEPCGKLLFEGDCYDVYENGAFYHIPTDKIYYARKVPTGNREYTVYIAEKNKGKIWQRLLFDLADIDELAGMNGGTVFHSSFIKVNGEGILFTAPCGTGKSTQAFLWEKYAGAEIINGDKSYIYCNNDEIRVAGLPFSGSSDICFNDDLPLKAVVRLYQAKENKATRLTGLNAYKAVHEGCYHCRRSIETEKNITAFAMRIASTVPVLRLDCLPDENAVETLKAELN